MLRFVDPANLLTMLCLLSALAGTLLAVNGLTAAALVALIVCGLCDLFDGLVARRLSRDEQQRRFGAALDSIVDGAAFGLAPSVMLYCAGLQRLWQLPLLAALPVCVAWRVAWFDVVGLDSQGSPSAGAAPRYYRGMPATYVALVLPLAALAGLAGDAWFQNALSPALAFCCLAMVSPIPFRKPGGAAYLGFALLAVTVVAVLCWRGHLLPSAMRN